MKTFELKSLNGKWYQGQLVIRYNLLNVLRVLILAALAAVALAILYWIVKGLIWCFVQLTPAFVWIGDNWWWLLLSLLGIVGLVWAWMYGLFRNLFKRRPKMNRPQHEAKETCGRGCSFGAGARHCPLLEKLQRRRQEISCR